MNQSTIQEVDLSTLKTTGRGFKLKPEVVDQLHKAFELEASIASIAHAFNISKMTVFRYKQKYNKALLDLSYQPNKTPELNKFQEMENRIKRVLKRNKKE